MERFLEYLGERLYRIRLAIDDFIFLKLSKSNTNKILFLTSFLIPIALIIAFTNSALHGIFYKVLFVLGYLLLGFVILSIYAIYFYSEKKMKAGFYGFRVNRFNIRSIDYELLLLDNEDKENFMLLLRGRKVKNRINYTLPNKSKTAANYRFLFTIFHLFIQGGIVGLEKLQKERLLQLFEESFFMNGEKVNPDTFRSSFSTWKRELNTPKGIATLQSIKKIFKIG